MKSYTLLPILFLSAVLVSCGTQTTEDLELQTRASPSGSGSITVEPEAVMFEENAQVVLTAKPNEGWIFQEWVVNRVNRGTSNPLTLHMNSDKSVTAMFERLTHPLTVTVQGEGRVEQEIVSEPAKTTDYHHDTNVELEAIPGSERWAFSNWEGDVTGDENPITILLNEEKQITAVFNELCCVKSFGGSGSEEGRYLIPTNDNRFAVTGWTNSDDGDFEAMNRGGKDVYLTKMDNAGQRDWMQTYGGSGTDEGRSVIQTPDGGFVVTGWSDSNNGDFNGMNRGLRDIFLIKSDPNGGREWARTYGGSGLEEAHSVIRSHDSGFLVIGWSDSDDGDLSGLNKGGRDAVVIKTNSEGEKMWVQSIAGSGPDMGFSMALASDNGVIVTGWTNSTDGDFSSRGDTEGYDVFLVKLNAGGEKQWVKTFGGNGRERPSSLILEPGDEIVLAGWTTSADGDFEGLSYGSEDIFLMKTGSSGNLQWVRTFGGSGVDGGKFNDENRGTSVVSANGGGFLLAGSTTSVDGDFGGVNAYGKEDIFLIKTNTNGHKQWVKTFGGDKSEEATSLFQSPARQLFMTGWSESGSGHFSNLKKGDQAGFFLKLDPEGNLLDTPD